MTSFKVGNKVQAVIDITEENFANKEVHYHARQGDLGTVEYVDSDGCPTVRFKPSGTATIVGDHEVAV